MSNSRPTYRPWSAPHVPPDEARPVNAHQVAVSSPYPAWVGTRHPVLPPLGHSWSPMWTHSPSFYPMMSYPSFPLSLHMLLPFVPTLGVGMQPTAYMYSNMVPMQEQGNVHNIYELPNSNKLPDTRLDNKSLDVVCEQVCGDVLERTLPDLIREVVNSCIDDIVKSYLQKANLLMDSPLQRRSAHSISRAEKKARSAKQRERGAQRFVRSAVHSSPAAVKSDTEKRFSSNDKVTRRLCESILEDLMFVQLLEAAYNRESYLASSAVLASTILDELLFDELMKLNWSRPPH